MSSQKSMKCNWPECTATYIGVSAKANAVRHVRRQHFKLSSDDLVGMTYTSDNAVDYVQVVDGGSERKSKSEKKAKPMPESEPKRMKMIPESEPKRVKIIPESEPKRMKMIPESEPKRVKIIPQQAKKSTDVVVKAKDKSHKKSSVQVNPKLAMTNLRQSADTYPLQCSFSLCGKKFDTFAEVIEHEHIHLCIKPYSCNLDLCEFRCESLKKMHHHLESKHGKVVIEQEEGEKKRRLAKFIEVRKELLEY